MTVSYKDLTPQQVAEVIAEYKAGSPVAQIWTKHGLDRYNFYTLLNKNCIEVGRSQVKTELPKATAEEVISKYKAGEKASKILTQFGIGTTVLYNILDENKVPRRIQRTKKHNRL